MVKNVLFSACCIQTELIFYSSSSYAQQMLWGTSYLLLLSEKKEASGEGLSGSLWSFLVFLASLVCVHTCVHVVCVHEQPVNT